MSGYLFLDLETGGFDPDKHAICQVAAIRTNKKLELRGSFRTYVKPAEGLIITPDSTNVHGLTAESLANEPEEHDAAFALRAFIATDPDEDLIFAGYACPFDLKMLEGWRKRLGFESWGFKTPWWCLMEEVKKRYRLSKWLKLTEAAEKVGVPFSGAHDAAADIFATLKIAQKLYPQKVSA